MAKQLDAAGPRVVKPRNQVDERRLAAAGAANDADRLARRGGKTDALQARRARAAVGEADVLKGDGRGPGGGRQLRRGGVGHRGGRVQQLVDADAARNRAGDRDDKVGRAQQVGQNLVEVADQGDDLPLGQRARVDKLSAAQKHRQDAQVDDHIGRRVEQRRDAPGRGLHLLELVVGRGERVDLILLAGENARTTRAPA